MSGDLHALALREATLILIVLIWESLLGWINLVAPRAASESLLCLNFRDRLDPTRFRSGKGDLIASMQLV